MKGSMIKELRNFLETSKMPVSVFQFLNGQYQCILVSDGACGLFELSRSELLSYLTNKSFYKTHPEDASKMMEAAKAMIHSDEIITTCRLMKQGSYHPVVFHVVKQTTKDGSEFFFIYYTDMGKAGDGNIYDNPNYLQRHQQLLSQDSVTGLPNANFYATFADGALKEFMDHSRQPFIVVIAISGMHYYNNCFGLEAGNILFRETAGILTDIFNDDFCCRYDYDHFVVLTCAEDVNKKAEEVRARFRDLVKNPAVEIKAGIYPYQNPKISSLLALDFAESALESIASDPRTFICRFDQEVEKSFNKRYYILNNYEKAIREKWIRLYLQPIIDSSTGQAVRCEALARWVDPYIGFLSPADFIPLLEQEHRLWELDLCILSQVCAHKTFLKTSFNLSRFDLDIPDIHKRINQICDQYGVPHSEIAIEITESALLEHEDQIESRIRQFHTDGYEVWLDDFGSGYSSLNTLQKFDFDLLKIDMNFLIFQNQRTLPILRGIVEMAEELGINSLTEGVETAEQAAFVKKIHCNFQQGFYYAKPLSYEDFCRKYPQLITISHK